MNNQSPSRFVFNGDLSTWRPFIVLSFFSAVTLRVYTFKEEQYCEMRFETGRLTTTQQIISKILESLGIPPENEQVFSLWLTSKHLRKCG